MPAARTDRTAPRVVVIGAGIAGLSVAAALERVGLDCRLYERADELVETGAGIQLSPNATRLLTRVGVWPQVPPAVVRPAAVEIRRWDDDALLLRSPLGDACVDRYASPYLCVHRADLQAELARRVAPSRIELGRECVGVEETPDGAVVTFADGGTVTADLVVGADGIRSAVRGQLSLDRAAFSGQTALRGLVPTRRLPGLGLGADGEPVVTIWMGPGRHLVCYPVCGGDDLSLAATVSGGDGDETWRREADPSELAAAYQGWNPRVQALAAGAEQLTRWALYDRPPVRRWSAGRVVLVGDAAHPMLPFGAQGAAQAVEDAFALAACLNRAGVGPHAGASSASSASSASIEAAIAVALQRYAGVRAPRVTSVFDYVRGNVRNHHHADGAEQRTRDREMSGRWGPDGLDWLYGYDAEATAVAAG